MRGTAMKSISQRRVLLLLCLNARGISTGWTEWSATTQGTLFYTDDVGIFSATRRLIRDGDPTQPALDSKLTGQGGDFVFDPPGRGGEILR